MGVTGIGIGIGIGPFGGSPPPSASYVLDEVTGAAAAFSVRKIRAAYSGAAMRVRRSSDNAETDIGFSGEDLDTAALLSHCGAGSGYVVTWYDQSGNGADATQSSTARQPRIVDTGTVDTDGNGVPLLYADPSSTIEMSASVTTTQPFDVYAVGAMADADFRYVCDDSTANDSAIIYTTAGTYRMFAGTALNTGVTVTTAERFFRALFNGASSKMTVDGTDVTGNAGSGAWANGLALFNKASPASARNALSMQEFIVFDSDQSANTSTIADSVNAYYGITVP